MHKENKKLKDRVQALQEPRSEGGPLDVKPVVTEDVIELLDSPTKTGGRNLQCDLFTNI